MNATPVHKAVTESADPRDFSWNFVIPFALVHLGCFAAIWTGVSWQTVTAALVLYGLRMFGITAGYHRLYSHRAYYIPNMGLRCVMWFLATSSAQRHVRWWASHHRHHHRHSDTEHDLHAPGLVGTMWAHMGWQYHKTAANWDDHSIRDFDKAFPELRTIDRFAWVSPLVLAAGCTALWGGEGLAVAFCWSTVANWHVTFTINSINHVWGTRKFDTTDTSKNNMLLALLSFGEGWHNNHHAFQTSCRQGHTWWQVDLSWMILKVGERFGLVTRMRVPPPRAMAAWAKN
jgi:stearoyl-CoA desaturase (delta-9 desaturase)